MKSLSTVEAGESPTLSQTQVFALTFALFQGFFNSNVNFNMKLPTFQLQMCPEDYSTVVEMLAIDDN